MIKINFWQKKENFLILEVSGKKSSGFLLSLDEEKNLKLEKYWPDFSWIKVSRRFLRHLEKWKVIVSADPSFASTISMPVKLEREAGMVRSPLSSIELENLLAQTSAKVFTQVRGDASRELGIDELDTILIDNRVSNFKIDGHHVLNPIDFKAKRLEALLELTLTTRSIFEDWKNFFNVGQAKNFFFTEISRSELFALKRFKSLPINLLVLNPGEFSHFFTLEKAAVGEVINRHRIRWSTSRLLEIIEKNFGVSRKVSLNLYNLFLEKGLSTRLERHISVLIKPSLDQLIKSLEHLRVKGHIYIDSNLNLPPALSLRKIKATTKKLPTDELTKHLGFSIIDESSWPWAKNQIFKHLAPFIEFYYNNEDLSINHWLRRRLHWLGSSK